MLSARLIGILSEKTLLAADKYRTNGVSYHVAEVFLDEMREFLALAVETLELMLKPFISVLEKSAVKVPVNKIKLNVFYRLLDNGRKLLNLEKKWSSCGFGQQSREAWKSFSVAGIFKAVT